MPIQDSVRTGWTSGITKLSMVALVFLVVSGFIITFASFSATVEWGVLVHTAVGLLSMLPILWYMWVHWDDYKKYNMSDSLLLGYVATLALLVCIVSGVVVTWQGLFGIRMSPVWRNVHLYSTWAAVLTSLPHVLLVWIRTRSRDEKPQPAPMFAYSVVGTLIGLGLVFGLAQMYSGSTYVNELPEDYNFLYGEDRPFAPSLAVTTTGGAFDAESLAGSDTCGTAGCHTQILEEWQPSAHRYSAMDPLFQTVQGVMAEQNGAESTRYCGGCHDPISLFSGTKNIFVEDLTGLHGYNEGISCLVCHGVQETDLQGNANYVMTQPATYLWQWNDEGAGKFFSDFLIRTYPDKHMELSKRMFKAPEYCAACHKQFIDEEVNRVGWVQLQNQYDNWKASHWYTEGDPEKTIECRECHMPLIESTDPSAGDSTDYNRTADDGMHRSHRFIAANAMVPAMLQIEGWEEQVELTNQWLRGELNIPEIEDKWSPGPVIKLALEVPEEAPVGEVLPIRVVMTANKVGHDFPTGPLDIIQSWVQIEVKDPSGQQIFVSGTVDDKNFIEPGSFMFKAEPVDQYGNLIDRHNLWEMVGVRYRRALFPGYSDTVEYLVETDGVGEGAAEGGTGNYEVTAKLMYRKVDQFLINFLLGEDSGLTAPIVQITGAQASIPVVGDTVAERETGGDGGVVSVASGG